MKKSISVFFGRPWYPLAFAVYPVLALFAANVRQLESVVLWRPLFISILCACVLLTLLRLLFSDWSQAAFCTAALVLLFFLYGHVYAFLKTVNFSGIALGRHRLLLAAWIGLAVLTIFLVQRKKINVQAHAATLNTIALVLLVFPIFSIVSWWYSLRSTALTQSEPPPSLGIQSGQSLPDVYYIILDSYTRSDVLKKVYGYDNSAFLDELDQMGFYVAECSTSNYMWTETLLGPFQDEKVALTYGRQRGPEFAKFSEQQIFHQWFPDKSKPQQETAFCNNANAAIRKSLWELNPYDETLTGLEDLAWAKWAKDHGHLVSYVAEAEIVHVHNETPHGVYNRYRREAMALRKIYPEAHFSLYDFLRLTLANVASDLWHAARQGILLKNLSSIFWFRFMQFHGTRMGHRESSLVTPQLRETFYYARGRKSVSSSTRQVEPIRYNQK